MRKRYFSASAWHSPHAELLSAEDADVPLRWRRPLEFYDHRETRIRAAAQVAFAGVVDSHRAQQELIQLLSWVRDRWWLRLSPEDVDAHSERASWARSLSWNCSVL